MSFKLILKTPPIQTDALSLKKRLVNIIILNPYLEFYVLSEDMKCFPAFLVDRVDKSIALVFSQKSVSLNFNFFIANTDLVIDTQNKGAATIKELSVKDLSFSVSDCAFSISQMRFRRYDSIQTCFCLCESGDIFDHCNECFHFLMYNEEVIDIIHDRLIDATRVSNEWFFFDNVFFQFDFTINICNILNRKDIDNAVSYILKLLQKKRSALSKYDFSREGLLKAVNKKLLGKEIFKLIYCRQENRLDTSPMIIKDESKEKIFSIELVDNMYFISLYDFLSIFAHCYEGDIC